MRSVIRGESRAGQFSLTTHLLRECAGVLIPINPTGELTIMSPIVGPLLAVRPLAHVGDGRVSRRQRRVRARSIARSSGAVMHVVPIAMSTIIA